MVYLRGRQGIGGVQVGADGRSLGVQAPLRLLRRASRRVRATLFNNSTEIGGSTPSHR
ncbi:MAG: hypothetical protein OXJ62_00390 [Spirochaetaceae bacterium]|nr:hypothetical protein [Spirochaetaceae bacterium]